MTKFQITYSDGYKITVKAQSASEAHRENKYMRTAEVGEYTPIVAVDEVKGVI